MPRITVRKKNKTQTHTLIEHVCFVPQSRVLAKMLLNPLDPFDLQFLQLLKWRDKKTQITMVMRYIDNRNILCQVRKYFTRYRVKHREMHSFLFYITAWCSSFCD